MRACLWTWWVEVGRNVYRRQSALPFASYWSLGLRRWSVMACRGRARVWQTKRSLEKVFQNKKKRGEGVAPWLTKKTQRSCGATKSVQFFPTVTFLRPFFSCTFLVHIFSGIPRLKRVFGLNIRGMCQEHAAGTGLEV